MNLKDVIDWCSRVYIEIGLTAGADTGPRLTVVIHLRLFILMSRVIDHRPQFLIDQLTN